jgi:hypothetical protein
VPILTLRLVIAVVVDMANLPATPLLYSIAVAASNSRQVTDMFVMNMDGILMEAGQSLARSHRQGLLAIKK